MPVTKPCVLWTDLLSDMKQVGSLTRFFNLKSGGNMQTKYTIFFWKWLVLYKLIQCLDFHNRATSWQQCLPAQKIFSRRHSNLNFF